MLASFVLRPSNLIHGDASPIFQAQNTLLVPPESVEISEESRFLLVARPARFRQGWQSVAAAQRVGLGLAATDPRFVSVPTPALDQPCRQCRVRRRRDWGAENRGGH